MGVGVGGDREVEGDGGGSLDKISKKEKGRQ